VSVLRDWAAFAVNASSQPLSERLSLHLADGVLAWRAGRLSPEGRQLHAWHAQADASLPGQAALMAALLRLSEVDDIHRASGITPTAIALPAVLPWRRGRSASDIAHACLAGIEVSVAVGLAMGGVGLFARGQWPSLAVAPLGAAAALGRLLGLDEQHMIQALALAALQSVRTPGRSLSDLPARWLLFGQAVRSGCVSALAAAQGMQADVAAAEAVLALSEASVPEAAHPALLATSFKPHPGAKQSLAALAALQQLLPEVKDVQAIRRIEVFVPAAYVAMLQREPPQASRLARLVHGPWQLALQCCAPERLFDTARLPLERGLALQVQALAERIHIAHDPALDAHYPRQWPARVRLEDERGVRELTALDSEGDPGAGADAAWLLHKAQRVLGGMPDLARVRAALGAQWDEALAPLPADRSNASAP